MEPHLKSLLDRLTGIETELEAALAAQRARLRYWVEGTRVTFEAEAKAEHRRLRTGLARFLAQSRLLVLLTAPFVYGLIVPLVLLDAAVAIFQATCFRFWRIPRVRRADYLVIDRHHLAYLNGVEKLNCLFCEYANGLIALVHEVASRTEQYWCPIKHARSIRKPHARYIAFVDYGDAERLHERIQSLRDELTGGGTI